MAALAGPDAASLVHVIDDDEGLRRSLEDLLQSVGYEVATYGSTAEFLARPPSDRVSCLVLDVRLPGTSGLDFQDDLAKRGSDLPIVVISGHGDVPMTVRAMRAGALDFIEKPFRDQDLLDAVGRALDEARRRAPIARQRREAEQRIGTLTPREREVIALVMTGKLSKQIAFELGIQEVTVKLHRASAMRKLGVRTVLELTRFVDAEAL